jgi:intracellular multiplication protein IcmO
LLGVSLEGEYSQEDKPGIGPSPFPVVLDELAYYATSGLDRMLAQGRSLNISFLLGFQEIAGIWARLGEKTASLLGNANLTIAMRQQESGRTRQWIEQTAGQSYVTQVSAYQGADDGSYREARHAEVRPVSRVDWQDLTSLIEGEAIVLFGGRRIYARIFHAKIDDRGTKRLGRTIMLREPDPANIRERLKRADARARLIESGILAFDDGTTDASPAIAAMANGMMHAASRGGSVAECAEQALRALSGVPVELLAKRPPPPDGMPVTSVTPMLEAASAAPVAGAFAGGRPEDPVDASLVRRLAAIEQAAGQSPAGARAIALRIVTERDEGLSRPRRVEPPAMSEAEFLERLRAIVVRLRRPDGGATLDRAA